MTRISTLPSAVPAALPLEHDMLDGLVYFRTGVPPELRAAVERHHGHLHILADQLRRAGVAPAQATAHIDVAIASYREALETAAASMRDFNP